MHLEVHGEHAQLLCLVEQDWSHCLKGTYKAFHASPSTQVINIYLDTQHSQYYYYLTNILLSSKFTPSYFSPFTTKPQPPFILLIIPIATLISSSTGHRTAPPSPLPHCGFSNLPCMTTVAPICLRRYVPKQNSKSYS